MTTEFETEMEKVAYHLGRGNMRASMDALISAVKIIEARPSCNGNCGCNKPVGELQVSIPAAEPERRVFYIDAGDLPPERTAKMIAETKARLEAAKPVKRKRGRPPKNKQ